MNPLDDMRGAAVRFRRANGAGGELDLTRGDFTTLIDIVQRHFGGPERLGGPELPKEMKRRG